MKSLTKLFIPIAMETLCYILAGMVDTMMLSTVGDNAVGAVGTANTYINVFIIMIGIVSSGMTAVMTQYIGAEITEDAEMIALVGKLLAIDIILEVGRVTNLVFGQALKTSGDALYTTVIAVIFMYLCMVGGTWLFGIRMNMLVAGAYIGLAGDECVRAVFMFLRWQSGRWKTKGFIGQQ